MQIQSYQCNWNCTHKEIEVLATMVKRNNNSSTLASVAISYEMHSLWSHLSHTHFTHSRPVPSRASSVKVQKHTQHSFVSISSVLVLEEDALDVNG